GPPRRTAHGAADDRREQREVRGVPAARGRIDPRPRGRVGRAAARRRRGRRAGIWRRGEARRPRSRSSRRAAAAAVRRSRDAHSGQRAAAHRGRDRRPGRIAVMIRAYVLDDEPLAVDRLRRLLGATGRVEIAGSSTDPDEALAFLRAHDVDLLFLDIQMPGLTGFELLERLERDVAVIFTTAYDRYAIDAFTVNSIDYLLKPIEPERLDRALDKAERMTAPRAAGATTAPRDIRALAREVAAALSPSRKLERIASRVGERT